MKFQHCALLLLASGAYGADLRGGRTTRVHERGLKSSKSSKSKEQTPGVTDPSKSSKASSSSEGPVATPAPGVPPAPTPSSKTSKKSSKASEPSVPSESSKTSSKMTKKTGSSKMTKKSSIDQIPDVCAGKDLSTLEKFTIRKAGPDSAALLSAVGALATELGTPLNNINWDRSSLPRLPNSTSLPGDFFKNTTGMEMTCDGCDFLVSGINGTGDFRFDSINAEASKKFTSFSEPSLFATTDTTKFSVQFSAFQNDTDAAVTGFGLVFVDVDEEDTTSVTYYDEDDCVLAKEYADVYDSGLSLVGVVFADSIVSRVEITAGDLPLDGEPDDTDDTDGTGSTKNSKSSSPGTGKSSKKSSGKSSKKSSKGSSIEEEAIPPPGNGTDTNSTLPGNSTNTTDPEDSLESLGSTKTTKSSKKGATGETTKSSKKGGSGESAKSSKGGSKSTGKSSKKSSGKKFGDDVVVMDNFWFSEAVAI